jgi:hypothetical protein
VKLDGLTYYDRILIMIPIALILIPLLLQQFCVGEIYAIVIGSIISIMITGHALFIEPRRRKTPPDNSRIKNQ